MLTAFTARPLVEFKQRDKSRIESVLAHGDRVLVGLNSGSLRVYRVNELDGGENNAGEQTQGSRDAGNEGGSTVKPTDLLRELEKFSRYKIEQLALIKEAKVLVSLSAGYVSFHDLQTYELQEQLTQTKGASTFAVTSNIVNDPETGVPSIVSQLAVAVKRRIMLWTWRDMELEGDTREISLVSGIKSLTWVSGTKLVAGLSSNFVMVDMENADVTDLAGPGSIGGPGGQESGRFAGVGAASMSYIGMGGMVPKPLATGLMEGQVLLAKDINTHFIDTDGNSLGRRQIPWSSAPVDVGYSYPFLLALHDASKGVLEVRNPETLSLLQSVSLPSTSIMHIPQPNTSLAHAGKGFLVASDRVIWRMEALSYDTQVDALMEGGYLDEAISLISMLEAALLEDKPRRLREVKRDKANALFGMRKYRDSMDLFTEISAPPETVIRLYPKMIAGDLSVREDQEDTDSDSKPKPNGTQTHDTDAEDGPSKTAPQAASVRSSLGTKTDGSSDSDSVRGKNAEDDKPLEGKDLRAAVRELQAYLADVRRRFQRFLNADGTLKMADPLMDGAHDEFTDSVTKLLDSADENAYGFAEKIREKARLVDTTLFRAHMYATPSLAGSLFRIANFCDPKVVMERLEETGRYNDLIDFLYGKRLHRQALELLQKFGQAETAPETAPQLHGPRRTVGYLQNLAPDKIDLILQFAEWPVREDPELGMEIFLADTENAEMLSRPQVLEFLRGIDLTLAVRYLEHVIGELNDMTPDLHQVLLYLYLERLQKHKSGELAISGEDSVEWRDRLLEMLKSSSQYSPAKMLDRLDREGRLPSASASHTDEVDPEYSEARAIVFSKMGQHRQALNIYVFKLGDYAKAEEYVFLSFASFAPYTNTSRYCNQIHLAEDPMEIAPADTEEEQPSIYLTLLSLYLSPPHGYQPQYGPALEILAKHGSRLPANSALDLIPESLPVKELEFYFRGRMRAVTSLYNETKVVSNLHKAESIKTQAQLFVGEGTDGRSSRSRHVTVTEERVCGICHKRLGGSVINVSPE